MKAGSRAEGSRTEGSQVEAARADAPTSRRAARQRAQSADSAGADQMESNVQQPAPSARPDFSSSRSSDLFEQASQTFRAATDAASNSAADSVKEESAPEESETHADKVSTGIDVSDHVVPRRSLRKVLTVGATVGVMSLASLLAVGMTLPAEAVAALQGGGANFSATSLVAKAGNDDADAADDEIQAFVTSSDVQNESLVRSDSFSTISLVELASEEGINYSNEVFTNDPEAAIQWPFKVGVAMSSGYGMRWGRLHEGIDFVPGEGAPIQAIADGVVRIATEQGGAYGVTVYIDHVIDGQIVTSHYSHMQYGSLQVSPGQTVKVGDTVGRTGNTGRSYGAHLHFEIIINDATIDPMPWLRENAGRYSY